MSRISEISKDLELGKAGGLGLAFGTVAAIATTPVAGLAVGGLAAVGFIYSKALRGIFSTLTSSNSKNDVTNDHTPQ